MGQRSRIRTRAGVVTAAVSAVMLAACGGSSDDSAVSERKVADTTSSTIASASTTLADPASTTPVTTPPAAPAADPVPTPPPTVPAPRSPTWDEIRNASIPSLCEHPPTTLVDGRDVTLGEYDGTFLLTPMLRSGQSGIVEGVPSDAGPLTAIVFNCNRGGVGWPDQVMFFAPGGAYFGHDDMFEADWAGAGLSHPGRGGITSIGLVGDELEVVTSAIVGMEPECCAAGTATVRLRAGGGGVRVTSVTAVPVDDFTGDGAPPECTDARIDGTPMPSFCAEFGYT